MRKYCLLSVIIKWICADANKYFSTFKSSQNSISSYPTAKDKADLIKDIARVCNRFKIDAMKQDGIDEVYNELTKKYNKDFFRNYFKGE